MRLFSIRGKIRQELVKNFDKNDVCECSNLSAGFPTMGFDNFIDLSAGKAIPSDVGFGESDSTGQPPSKPGDVVLIVPGEACDSLEGKAR